MTARLRAKRCWRCFRIAQSLPALMVVKARTWPRTQKVERWFDAMAMEIIGAEARLLVLKMPAAPRYEMLMT